MPNFNIFNSKNDPLNVFLINTSGSPIFTLPVAELEHPTVVVPIEELATENGLLFAGSTGAISVPANGFLTLQLTNPAGAARVLVFSRLSGGATVNTRISILRNGTFTAAGTTITPRNTNFSSPDNSVWTAKFISQASDPTVGGVFVIEYSGRIRINPNTTMLVRMANNTNKTNLLSLNFSYWQESI
ncbi:hypothetical protein [Bacillus sp. FJAT-45350]|uniref:hypothetical protein n=1 Tax=Bacillus sp. FJAT-45350 TaxID=2011014 RepID=UPI000BB6AFE4|nr:hypothetical protein [Bacillus sp. FJAT-45350]